MTYTSRNQPSSIIYSIPRGVEQEYALVTHPPSSGILLNRMIDEAIVGLKEKGFISDVEWSLNDETGNLAYERARAMQWTLPGSSTEQAYNGARVYNDAAHFEVSTPVYVNPVDSVIYERVSEYFAYLGTASLEKIPGACAYKVNTSTKHDGTRYISLAWGTHGSSTVNRERCNLDKWNEVERALVPYIVTRILITGAGGVVAGPSNKLYEMPFSGALIGDTLKFAISPRALFMKHISSLDTGEDRGILNERDEPHADQAKYWRLHDINFEGLRSDFQIFIRDVMQAFVLAAFNRGYLVDAPQIKDPLDAIRILSLDFEQCDWKLTLSNGSNVSAIEDVLEGFYLAKIEDMLDKEGADSIDTASFSALKWLIQRLKERRLESLINGIDWITKLEIAKEYGVKDVNMLMALCNQYTLIDEGTRYYVDGAVDLDATESLFDPSTLSFLRNLIPLADFEIEKFRGRVKRALRYGPSDTREYLRTLVLHKIPQDVKMISWSRVYFDRKRFVEMKEPTMYTANDLKGLEEALSVDKLLQMTKT